MEYAKILLPYIIGFIMTFLGYLLGKKKQESDITNTQAQTNKVKGETNRSLVEFYEEQVVSLIAQVKELKDSLQVERDEKVSCEQRLSELEVKFNLLATKFTLLEKNLIKNNEF
jgi:hypothetical protein